MPRGRKPQTTQAGDAQLTLPFGSSRARREARIPRPIPGNPRLRVVDGGGSGRDTKLRSRDDVARLLMRSAADVLTQRITWARANAIQRKVDRVFALFDASTSDSEAATALRRELDALEELARGGAARIRGGSR